MKIKEEYELIADVCNKSMAQKTKDYQKKWVSQESLVTELADLQTRCFNLCNDNANNPNLKHLIDEEIGDFKHKLS